MLQSEDVRGIAELEVRKYFDYFLDSIFPKLIIAHADGCPHGKVVTKARMFLLALVACVSFILGDGLDRLYPSTDATVPPTQGESDAPDSTRSPGEARADGFLPSAPELPDL
ncbi:MAG: hypothetical protein IMZ50_13140, partial [Candidatus Atribacteria bacterium]|nr:hypothetical protein [Candidatus Atribacteria bacterium]